LKIALVSIPVADPLKAHEIYTTSLGFQTKEFDAAANLAVVVAPEDPTGTAILLEPCAGSFAEDYQKAAYAANLPIMALGSSDPIAELARLKAAGVKLRPELDNPKWGLENMFEDGCGNILMIEKTPS